MPKESNKRGNAQISTSYAGKDATVVKQGQTEGTRYGMNPKVRSGGSKKKG